LAEVDFGKEKKKRKKNNKLWRKKNEKRKICKFWPAAAWVMVKGGEFPENQRWICQSRRLRRENPWSYQAQGQSVRVLKPWRWSWGPLTARHQTERSHPAWGAALCTHHDNMKRDRMWQRRQGKRGGRWSKRQREDSNGPAAWNDLILLPLKERRRENEMKKKEERKKKKERSTTAGKFFALLYLFPPSPTILLSFPPLAEMSTLWTFLVEYFDDHITNFFFDFSLFFYHEFKHPLDPQLLIARRQQ